MRHVIGLCAIVPCSLLLAASSRAEEGVQRQHATPAPAEAAAGAGGAF